MTHSAPTFFYRYRTHILLFIAAMAVRGVVMYDYFRSPFWKAIWMDSATYNKWALSIVNSGDWVGKEPFFMTPLYPYVLAVLYSLFGTDLLVVRLFQAVVSSGTVVLIYMIARDLFSHRVGVIAGVVAACYGPFVFFVNLFLVETIKVFLVTSSLYFSVQALKYNTWKWWFGTGIIVGASILARPTDTVLGIVIAFAILFVLNDPWKKKFRTLLVVTGGIAVMVLPATIRNYAVSQEIILVTSNGGLNFYLGNNPKAVGLFYNPEGFNMVDDPSGKGFLEQQFQRPFTATETSNHWMSKAVAYITGSPIDFLALMGKKLLLFFHHKEIGQLGYGYAFMSRYISPFLAYLVIFIIVFPLALAGMWFSRAEKKKLSLLYGFLGAQIFSVILFFITDRYRLSALPMLIIFSAVGVDILIESYKKSVMKRIYEGGSFIIAGILIATVLNFGLRDDFSTEYYNIGLTHFEEKRYQEAFQAFSTSLQLRDAYPVRNALGNVFAAIGNYPQAVEQYSIAERMNPLQAVSVFSIGSVYARMQQWDSCLVYFNAAIKINPRFAPAYLNKGLTHYYLQQFPEALEALETYKSMEQDPALIRSVEGDIDRLRTIISGQPR